MIGICRCSHDFTLHQGGPYACAAEECACTGYAEAQPAACPDCRGVCEWTDFPHALGAFDGNHGDYCTTANWRVTQPCARHGAGGEGGR